MRKVVALLVALAVIAGPVAFPIAAAAKSIAAAASADGGEKPCSCEKTGGNCSNTTVCGFGCFADTPAVLGSIAATGPARDELPHDIVTARAALAIPPPLLPPRI